MDGQPDFSLPFPHSGTLAFINAESVSLHVHNASEISRISLRLLLQASGPTQLVDPLFGLVNGIHEIIDGHSHSVLLLGGLAVRWQLHDTAPKASRFGKRVLGDFCRIVLLHFRSKFPGRKESCIELLASFDVHSGDLDPARTALRRRRPGLFRFGLRCHVRGLASQVLTNKVTNWCVLNLAEVREKGGSC